MIKYSFSTLLRYCCCSAANSYPTLCDLMDSSIPCSSVLHYLMEFAHIHIHWVSDATYYLILCHPLLFLPLIFSNELTLCIRWLKYWNFSFSISPSNEFSGLISLRIDWFNLFAVQESSPAPQFESNNSLVFSLLYVYMNLIAKIWVHAWEAFGKTASF